MSLKATCKYFFPGQFNKFVQKVEDAFDETDKRDKKKIYIELKKDFEKLKREKRNSCNENEKNTVEKKIDTLSLLLLVLEIEIDMNADNMVKTNRELSEVENELDTLNISINTVNKGEKLLRDKIKQLYKAIEFTANVNLLVSNVGHRAEQEKRAKNRSKNTLHNMQKRLAKLSGGKRTTRKRKY
jgi:ABC-type transporter Mla subunit MlaD